MSAKIVSKGSVQLIRGPGDTVADVHLEIKGGSIEIMVARWEHVEMPVKVTVV